MRGYYHQTPSGTFAIVERADRRWWAMYENETLGGYQDAQAAHDDLLGNYCMPNSKGLDTGEVGLPADLRKWRAMGQNRGPY